MLQCGPVVEQVGRFMGASVARHSGEIGGLGCGETCRMGAQNIGVGVCGFGVSSGTKKRFCSPGEKPGRELGWRKVTVPPVELNSVAVKDAHVGCPNLPEPPHHIARGGCVVLGVDLHGYEER